MIKTSSALKGNRWRSIINPQNRATNWYLNHREDYGSWQWIKWKLFIYAFTAAIAGSTSYHFIESVNQHLPIQYMIVYWICNIWYLIYQYIITLMVIFFILYRIPLLDDAIGLKKELQVIAYLLFLQVVLGICFRVIDPNIISIDDEFLPFLPIFNQIVVLLMRFSRFGINYMQTRWVVNQYGMIQRHGSSTTTSSAGDSKAITLSSRMRKVVHKNTL